MEHICMAGWESLWQGLLWEAARRASVPASYDDIEASVLARSAAAIILARGAWEGYLNELIEWRELPSELKNQSCYDGLVSVHRELGLSFEVDQGGTWDRLLLLNNLRNKIVHHKAGRIQPGTGPWELAEKLSNLGLLRIPDSPMTWERALLSLPIARWSCATVGRAIIQLESIPVRRSRSLFAVQQAVVEALAPIDLEKQNKEGDDEL
jgi:hypothetical protein